MDISWIIFCSFLILFMQAGFLSLETGMTRSKNGVNVAMKNLSDFVVTLLVFWLIGFTLTYGETVNGWIALDSPYNGSGNVAEIHAMFLFYALFCGTASTIISGAIAERMRFISYIIVVALVAALVFPLMAHWVWNTSQVSGQGGWLQEIGFIDWAGGTVVHSLGGWLALACVLVLGPRIGRFGEASSKSYWSRANSNLPFVILGVFILIVGWIGFNGGTTLTVDDRVPLIVLNTLLAACGGGLAAVTFEWFSSGKPKVLPAVLGVISGLVSITASAHGVSPGTSIFIGAIGGIIAIWLAELLNKLEIDDAVGAIPVHLGGGIWGTLAIALFIDESLLNTSSRMEQLGVQLIGVGVCFVLAFGGGLAFMLILNRLQPIRVSQEDELVGLNISEHGTSNEISELISMVNASPNSLFRDIKLPEEDISELGQIGKVYNTLRDRQEHLVASIEAVVDERTAELQEAKSWLEDEIEQRKETEINLEREKDRANKASEIKTRFLANMSHEFRTPLNVILGFASILKSEKVKTLNSDEIDEYARYIHDSGDHLLNVVNDILDITKIEANCIEIREQEVALSQIVEECVGLLSNEAKEAGISLEAEKITLDDQFLVDRVRIKQVLLNIISNAIKFTKNGGEILVKAETWRSPFFALTVTDSGVGMNEAEVEVAMEPFRQVEDNLAKAHQGTGLGLSISKSLMNLHDGDLLIESEKGVGTRVALLFPMSRFVGKQSKFA